MAGFQCGNRALDCVQRHISVMSIRYNRGFHKRIGKNYAGVGYLTAGVWLSTAIILIGCEIQMVSPKS